MNEFVIHRQNRLRTGFTTGLCAAAAAKAAAVLLLSDEDVQNVALTAPSGAQFDLPVFGAEREADAAACFVVKDAGDDPDVTHGMQIAARIAKTEKGLTIDGGEGIGRVTKPGLKILPGRAAINPVPLRMIEDAVSETADRYGYGGGLHIVISAPQGAAIAKKTMNERLGIVGGISILGTTGVVEPMSDKAIIDTIRTAIDVQMAEDPSSLLVTPGNYGRDFAKAALGLDIGRAVKCSNFIGEMLDYAVLAGVAHMTFIGHAGKLIKVAGGIMNTHSAVADARMDIFAAHAAMAGAGKGIIKQIMACVTVDAAISLTRDEVFFAEMWNSIGQKIGFHLRERTKGRIPIHYIVFTQEYGVLTDAATG